MSPDELSSIEPELLKLKACPLGDDLLNRLEACATGRDMELTDREVQFENDLRKLPPARLSAQELDELAALTHGTPFAVDEKIVLFPKAAGKTRSTHRPMWRAAAAVALIGAATAFLVPQRAEQPDPATAAAPLPPTPTQAQEALSRPTLNLSPASFNRGIAEAQDEGVVWHGPDRPHRVLRIVYMDKVVWRNAQGQVFEVEQPRVEYILVPEKID
jgi:hypothetical protein